MGREHRKRRLGTALLALIAAYAQVLSLFAAYAASYVQRRWSLCGWRRR